MAQADLSLLSPVAFLDALQSNDEQVLQAMYTHNYPGVERYVLKNKGTTDDARDIYQEAFLAVWRNIKLRKFTPRSSLEYGAYLFRVSKNKWIDHLRAHKHLHTAALEEQPEEEDDIHPYIDAVKTQFAVLGEQCRELLARFYFKKDSLRAIAAHFSWTEASAKNNKYRCLKQLRALVTKNEQ